MNVFPFILEELGMIALMEVVFLLLRVKGRGASTKKRRRAFRRNAVGCDQYDSTCEIDDSPVSGGKEKKVLSLKRNVNCPRRMAVYAVFDVLDRMGCQYEQALVGDIRAEAKVLGHTSEYAFAVTEQTINTSILHVSMLRPASGLSEEEKQLAVRYLADSVLQHIDEVQALE